MKRYADTFYRYWYVVLLPIIVLPLLTYRFSRATSTGTASASANIYVTQTSASLLDGYNAGQTPAQNLSDVLNELVRTASFDLDVVVGSPLFAQAHPAGNVVEYLSTNLQATPAGPNLVSLSYDGVTAPETVQVMQSFLNTANRRVAALTAQQSASNTAALGQRLGAIEQQWTSDDNRLKSYLGRHHIPRGTVADQALFNPSLNLLYQQVLTDQSIAGDVQKQLTQAQQPATQAQPTFQVVDSPGATATRGVNKKVLNTLIALALGLLLGGGFIVVRTALDHSLRYADDATALLGLPVLGVVPYRTPHIDGRRARGAVRPGGNPANA